MIPFFHIGKTECENTLTPEQRLARRMAHLPEHTGKIAGGTTVERFLSANSDRTLGLIFDMEFWYGPECWQRWINALETDGLRDMPNVPAGNQEPEWRQHFAPSPYVTLRGLEHAAETMQAETWHTAAATQPVCFSVVVLPRNILADMPRTLTMEELPRIWADRHVKVRIFGGGWLHSFNSLADAGCRYDLLDMTDWHGNVLELGCDRGLMAKACRERGNQVTWIGMDRNPDALGAARSHMDLAIRADAEASLPFSSTLRFDRVVCGDFLEHLAYPWRFLKRLVHWTAPEGLLVASFPNVGHWSIVDDLLAGRWDETPSGILCVSHLRFGTRASWQRWLDESGWQAVCWESEQLDPPPGWQERVPAAGGTLDVDSLKTLRYRLVAKKRTS